MFFEESEPDIHTDLAYSLERNRHQKSILGFLQGNLKAIATTLLQTGGPRLMDIQEDDITRQITILLNCKLREGSGYLFSFEPKIGPDMLIFAVPHVPFSKPLFIVEAKRLSSSSNRDYVTTGIRRFKVEKHGRRHNTAAMLGYIQDKDYGHWFTRINSWIDDLIAKGDSDVGWAAQDRLRRVPGMLCEEYTSLHARMAEGPIKIHHFWLTFCN